MTPITREAEVGKGLVLGDRQCSSFELADDLLVLCEFASPAVV
jgi:hypothetical protein